MAINIPTSNEMLPFKKNAIFMKTYMVKKVIYNWAKDLVALYLESTSTSV